MERPDAAFTAGAASRALRSQVERTPGAVAVVSKASGCVRGAERAGEPLAHTPHAGRGRRRAGGICVERRVEMVVACWASQAGAPTFRSRQLPGGAAPPLLEDSAPAVSDAPAAGRHRAALSRARIPCSTSR